MKTVYTTTAIVALAAFPAFAGSYGHTTSDPVVRPAAAPEDAAGCRMRPIPGTNVWQKADPNCGDLGFTSPDPAFDLEDFVDDEPDDEPEDEDEDEDEVDCAMVSGATMNDAAPDPC